MKLGGLDITDVKIGDTQVDKVYQGINEVWRLVPLTGNLLEDYPGAAAAYSLRALDPNNYTGDAIRVRRASDNTEQDIGFVDNELDTSALTTFCSGTNGFVKTWYDQSGNARNATQGTAANQPQIVSSGSVILENGQITVEFASYTVNINKILSAGDFSFLNEAELFLVTKSATNTMSNGFIDFGTDSLANHYPFLDGNVYDGFGTDQRKSTGNPIEDLDKLNLYGVITKLNLWQSRINGLQHYQTTSNNVSFDTNCLIGQTIGSNSYRGFISELIIYPSDQSSNRTGIETNINDFYSIY